MSPRGKWAIIVALVALICLAGLSSYTYKASLAPAALSQRVVNWRSTDSSASNTKTPLHVPQLSKQLVREHALDNTLIVSYANAHHVDYALNWVTYLMANNITNYLIGALDCTTGETLSAAGVKTFALYSDEEKAGSKSMEGDLPFLSPGFLALGLHRAALARTILGFKVDVVISDLDTVWLHNPLPYFTRYPEADILVSSDYPGPTHDDEGLEDPDVMGRFDMNVGFMFFRSGKNTTLFAETWLQEMQQDASRWDQAEFNRLIIADMFKNHYSWWDGTDRWEKVFKPKAALSSNARVVWGAGQSVTVGALPVLMFSSGHIFFSQKLYERTRSPLHVVHANFCAGGAKRHRFRETQLWQRDKPSYYDVKRLLSYDVRHLEPPADFENLPTRQRVRFHLKSISSQLQQFWDAAAAAVALNRTLILPQFTCHCDEIWHWSLDHTPQWVCRYVGATNQTLPFTCPHDNVLNLMNLNDQPSKYGVAVRFRESSFLQNPRTPQAIKAGVRRIRLQDKPSQLASQQLLDQSTSQHAIEQTYTGSQYISGQPSKQVNAQHVAQAVPEHSESHGLSQQLRSQYPSQQLGAMEARSHRSDEQPSGSQRLGAQQLGARHLGSQQTSQQLGAQQLHSQPTSQQFGAQHALQQTPRQSGAQHASQQLPKHDQLQSQRRLLAALDSTPQSQPIVTQQPVSWIVTEAELRDSLSQYSSERVLHITDMGHVVLNSHRAWDKRRSHATHDNWRFSLFAAVQ